MTNKPKKIGTAGESAVVNVLRVKGYPHAERRALKGARDEGDITGTPGLCFEVKAGKQAWEASDADIAAWLAETEVERVNAKADVGILVVQRKGVGPKNAHRWWAYLTSSTLAQLVEPVIAVCDEVPVAPVRLLLDDVLRLLRWAGYGEPLPANVPVGVAE